MGICWTSYWGLPKPVAEIFQRAEAELTDDVLEYGPGHIVFSDYNLEDRHITYCLDLLLARDYKYELSEREQTSLFGYLQELLAIPESERCIVPEEYDGEHPENFPPQVETIRV